jgi:hypothetical protein
MKAKANPTVLPLPAALMHHRQIGASLLEGPFNLRHSADQCCSPKAPFTVPDPKDASGSVNVLMSNRCPRLSMRNAVRLRAR